MPDVGSNSLETLSSSFMDSLDISSDSSVEVSKVESFDTSSDSSSNVMLDPDSFDMPSESFPMDSLD